MTKNELKEFLDADTFGLFSQTLKGLIRKYRQVVFLRIYKKPTCHSRVGAKTFSAKFPQLQD